MRPFPLAVQSAAALGLAAILVACDKAPTSPRPPDTGGSNVPPGAGGSNARAIRVLLAGPATLAPGETGQFTATATYADGSSRDVSAEVAWGTENATVLSMTTTGLATGRNPGETNVQAGFNNGGNTSHRFVMVITPGTYRLSGIVRDAGLPASGVEVAVSEGPAEGLSTTTVNGSYRLYGVFGDTEIRVRRPGYEDQEKRIVVTAHQSLNFDLVLTRPRDQVEGTWALAINAADECVGRLPDEAMRRRYTAVLKQDGPRVTATLDGATFYKSVYATSNSFKGSVEPDRLTFQLAGAEESIPYLSNFVPGDVLEHLSDGPVLLSVGGSLVLSGSGNMRTGSLDGVFATFVGPPDDTRLQSCQSSRHRFELTR